MITYEMSVPGAQEKFAAWIKDRGGVAVWPNVNLSDPGKGPTFTPVVTDGKPTPRPHWSVASEPAEIVTNIDRFKFLTLKEVDRFHVAVRVGSQGTMLKLTDASSAKLRKRLDKYGDGARYHFDFDSQEAVIEVPNR